MKGLVTQQDTLLQEYKQLELTLKQDILQLQHTTQEVQQQSHSLEVQVMELQHQSLTNQTLYQQTLKRHHELELRCHELSKQCELELKKR
jgi:predicted component of type VI protein secretion system